MDVSNSDNLNSTPKTPMQRMEDSKNTALSWFLICLVGAIIFPIFLSRSRESYGILYYLIPIFLGLFAILSMVIYIKKSKTINKINFNMASFPSKSNILPIEEKQQNVKINVFFSYATEDSEKYKLKDITSKLEEFSNIQKVYYWERDTKADIIQYMNESLKKSDVLVLFCSQNIKESEPVKNEWGAAFYLNKAIVPVFVNLKDIPEILSHKKGVKYNFLSPEDFPQKLLETIKSHLS